MKIIAKKLTRKNFQGEGTVTFEFSPSDNTIVGDNREGKTKTYNSYLWLLYGKNEVWATNFDICPLDINHNKIPYLETDVECIFDVDGVELTLNRVVDRKWYKDEDSGEIILKSEPIKYFVNKTPVKKFDFEKRISDMIHEDMFKLLSTHDYFATLHWEKSRALLLDWVGKVDPVINDEKFKDLFSYIHEQKMSLNDYKTKLAFEKKGIEGKLQELPIRVDELSKQFKDVDMPDKKEIDDANRQLKEIDKAMDNAADAEIHNNKEIIKIEQDKFLVEQEIEQIKRDAVAEHSETANKLTVDIKRKTHERDVVVNDIGVINASIKHNESKIKRIGEDLKDYTDNFKLIKEHEETDTCFNCKQKLPKETLDEQKAKKAEKLSEILAKGNKKDAERDKLKQDIVDWAETLNGKTRQKEALDGIVDVLKTSMREIPAVVYPEERILELGDSVDSFEKAIAAIKTKKGSTEHLQAGKRNLALVLDAEKEAIRRKEDNKTLQKNIDEYKKTLADYREELADVMNREHIFKEYERRRYTAIEVEINKMFTYVSFKLYEQLKNGEWVACCKILVDGVDYNNSLNTEGKVNSGLAIIKFLHKKTGKYAPVWVDNAESVTRGFLKLDSQIIKLKAVENQKLSLTKN